MGLFPPEFIAGLIIAFFLIRIRPYFSISSALVNKLNFFLPPENDLIDRLNGKLPPLGVAEAEGSKKTKHVKRELTAEERMQQLYLKCTTSEHGIFDQTLFYELYDVLVLLVTTTVLTYAAGEALSFGRQFVTDEPAPAYQPDISSYGLFTAFFICLWFPMQMKFSQGLITYEARLGMGIGFIGFVAALFVLYAPRGLFDFNMETAFAMAGARIQLALRAMGFTDNELTEIAAFGDVFQVLGMIKIALLAGLFTSTSFLPAFRFARMYAEMTKDPETSWFRKALLHLNMVLPLLLAMFWVKFLSTDMFVPKAMAKCTPNSLTRDCPSTAATVWGLKETQWHAVRIYAVLLFVAVRLLTFRTHMQHFLMEPKDAIVQIVRRPGVINGELMKSKVRVQFNYVPIVAVQYLAPAGVLLACALLLARQTQTSLGFFSSIAQVLPEAWNATVPESGAVLPAMTPPDLGGFHRGSEITHDVAGLVMKGMAEYPILTPVFHASLFGFLIWWCSATWFLLSIAGLAYWKNMPHASTAEQDSAFERRNRQTPKSIKNQLKDLKMKKMI